MEGIYIRPAEAGDAAEIAKTTKDAFSLYVREAGIETTDALIESKENVAEDIQNKIVYCALLNERIVGSLRVEINEKEKTAYLSRFGVLPTNRNNGVGKALLKAVDEKLSVLGIEKLYLHTAANIDALMSFYKNAGFNVQSVSEDKGYPRALMVRYYTA